MEAVKKSTTKVAAGTKKQSRGTATQKKKEGLNEFGFKIGSASAQALELLATGKYTMAAAMAKIGTKRGYAYALAKASKRFRVSKAEDGTYKITKKH